MVMKYIYYLQLQLPKQYKIASVDITPKKTFIYIYISNSTGFCTLVYKMFKEITFIYILYQSIYIYIYPGISTAIKTMGGFI